MSEYNIPLRLKISNKEYDKLKYAKNKSNFVRNAINQYHEKRELEIESSKREMLEEIKGKIIGEERRFNEKLMKEQKLQEERLLNEIEKMCNSCDERIKNLNNKPAEDIIYESEVSFEEKVLPVLPTLQGMIHSERGYDYNIVRTLAKRVNVDPTELKDWIESNPPEMSQSDYLSRRKNRDVEKTKVLTKNVM